MTAAEFAELAIHFHGLVGLYRETGWLSLVRVTDVSFDARGARLTVKPVLIPGLRSDRESGWDVFSIWENMSASPTYWHQTYPGVGIDFDRELIDAVVAFVATLPPAFCPENYGKLRDFVCTSSRTLSEPRGARVKYSARKIGEQSEEETVAPHPRHPAATSPLSRSAVLWAGRHSD
jgi:hypothetical protein